MQAPHGKQWITLNKSHINRFTENKQENKSIILVDNASVDLLVCSDPLLQQIQLTERLSQY